jgi:hypothetical protein
MTPFPPGTCPKLDFTPENRCPTSGFNLLDEKVEGFVLQYGCSFICVGTPAPFRTPRTVGAQMERPCNETPFWYTLSDEAKLRGLCRGWSPAVNPEGLPKTAMLVEIALQRDSCCARAGRKRRF